MSDHWQYLIVLGLCLLITLPLEIFGEGVYRRPGRLIRAIAPFAAVFLVWDAVAIAAGIWWYNGKYLIGVDLPPRIPIEEVLFFVVIPVCGLLTYNAVSTILNWSRRR
ncbi:lycopene cyclase domain-containing protein [Mycobacterium sp. ML4]